MAECHDHPAEYKTESGKQDQVLVAILNAPRDLEIARHQHWYRIPAGSAKKWLFRRWPPRWLAFYQPKIFGEEAFAVHYYAPVLEVRQVLRRDLFPDEPGHEKANSPYIQLMLGPVQRLSQCIPSRRWRRIVFIQTTWQKFTSASEINDLYDESPLEDRLWAEFKRLQLHPERQEFISINKNDYALDFAFYCATGKLDVETDGDTWHSDPQRIPEDNRRDNDLETGGWKLLRFNTLQLREQMVEYCLPAIVQNINSLGGPAEGRLIPRDIHSNGASPSQLSLFDDQGLQDG